MLEEMILALDNVNMYASFLNCLSDKTPVITMVFPFRSPSQRQGTGCSHKMNLPAIKKKSPIKASGLFAALHLLFICAPYCSLARRHYLS